MDFVAEIRHCGLVNKKSISAIARDLDLSRPAVRMHCLNQCKRLYRRHK